MSLLILPSEWRGLNSTGNRPASCWTKADPLVGGNLKQMMAVRSRHAVYIGRRPDGHAEIAGEFHRLKRSNRVRAPRFFLTVSARRSHCALNPRFSKR